MMEEGAGRAQSWRGWCHARQGLRPAAWLATSEQPQPCAMCSGSHHNLAVTTHQDKTGNAAGQMYRAEKLQGHTGKTPAYKHQAVQGWACLGLQWPLHRSSLMRPRRMGRFSRGWPAPGGGGAWMPSLACCANIWPIRSPRLLPTWRPTSWPLR